jgi:hypothetical protein
MSNPKIVPEIALTVFLSFLVMPPGHAQTKSGKYPLIQFDNYGCMAKGRVQDCSGTVMQQILSDGKDAIPILISQLTETARTKNEIADYWGAILAPAMLHSLFSMIFLRIMTCTHSG